MGAALGFWFDFASTYSYVAAMRVERLAGAAGVAVEWRPFLLGPIFRAQGWNDSPFNLYPAKGRYMWRDLERLCAAEGLPWRRPSRFPQNSLLASRLALVAAEDGWAAPFARAVFAANFAEDRDIADPASLEAIVAALGRPAAPALERAATPAIKDRLRRETEEAARLGIFGAPSFVAGGELYWGNDRLEAALRHAGATVPPPAPPSRP
jgi:2-hydroxychromene-2-carboxylate isomerase